ncbi:MAG: SUMF1/EgtB/PvdO family nonheme iron enzyme [Gammaproteobacteria bacterium]
MSLEFAGGQTIGNRDCQEDSYLLTYLDHSTRKSEALLIVADGMGGHAAGNVASNLAVQTVSSFIQSHYPGDNLPALLRGAVEEANRAIGAAIRETPALQGMGCTLVAAILGPTGVYWASVGDSHLYALRNGQLEKWNADHSYGGYLDRLAGLGQPIEPEAGCSRNMLLSALTGDEIFEIDCPETPRPLAVDDQLLLASDGLNTLDTSKLVTLTRGAETSKQCVDKLLDWVLNVGDRHQDNTTVLSVRAHVAPPQPGQQPAAPQVEIDPFAAIFDVTGGQEVPVSVPAATVSAAESTPVPERRWGRWVAALCLVAGLGIAAVWLGLHRPARMAIPASDGDRTAQDLPAPDEQRLPPPAVGELPAGGLETPVEASPPPLTSPVQSEPFRDSGGPEMLWIPAGSFQMGNARPGADPEEQPKHEVILRRFGLSKYEVTRAEYGRFARATGRRMPSSAGSGEEPGRPVVYVSWADAVAYTRWLSQQTGHTYRLPSEAEWDYPAAAATTTPYCWGFLIGQDLARCYGCSRSRLPSGPVEVGRFQPNPWGLYDTAGNVMEWVQDCYHPSYASAPGDGSTWETPACATRAARGGSFGHPTRSLRTTKRFSFRPGNGYDEVGFRVARDP